MSQNVDTRAKALLSEEQDSDIFLGGGDAAQEVMKF